MYEYEGKPKGISGITKITCKNQKSGNIFSQVNFKYSHYQDVDVQTLVTSDNRKFEYVFKKHKYHVFERDKFDKHFTTTTDYEKYYLAKVDHPYAPKEKYKYEEKALTKELQIVKKSRDNDQRFLKIDYYQKGFNEIGEEIGNLNLSNNDFRLDRVRKLRAPVGTDKRAIVTHTFDYHATFKKDKENDSRIVCEGFTNVYDAHHHKTRYKYDKNHRLTSILRYADPLEEANDNEKKSDKNHRHTSSIIQPSESLEKKYIPYTKECFTWGENGDEGNLLEKILKDGNGTVLHSRSFKYDERGNVLTSTLSGNLTGESDKEQEIKTFTYSQDGLTSY